MVRSTSWSGSKADDWRWPRNNKPLEIGWTLWFHQTWLGKPGSNRKIMENHLFLWSIFQQAMFDDTEGFVDFWWFLCGNFEHCRRCWYLHQSPTIKDQDDHGENPIPDIRFTTKGKQSEFRPNLLVPSFDFSMFLHVYPRFDGIPRCSQQVIHSRWQSLW